VSVSAPSSTSGSQTDPASGLTGGRESRMGQDAFLKLLTTQLANQDPLQPQDNGEFLAQLAQFSSLEKLTSIETSIKELASAFKTLAGLPETPADGSGTGN
jgi:flagellar basal-body rod modification protein FlgD